MHLFQSGLNAHQAFVRAQLMFLGFCRRVGAREPLLLALQRLNHDPNHHVEKDEGDEEYEAEIECPA